MGFNFSEDEITNMYKIYQDCLCEIQEETEGIAKKLTEYAQEMKYAPLVKLSVETLKYYNEKLKQAELTALEDWKSGELSFTKVMEKMSAGENAKSRSKELETQIEQEIQSWKRLDDSDLLAIDTTNFKCAPSDFENIQQELNRFVESLASKQDEYANNIEDQKSENDIYISIEPVVAQSFAIVLAGFQSGISEGYASLAQEFETRADEVRKLGENAAQAAAAKSHNFISSGASALKDKVKQILD